MFNLQLPVSVSDAVVDRGGRTNSTVGVRSPDFVQNSITGASKFVEKRNTNYDDENDSDDWCLSKYLNHRSDNEISDDDDGLEPSDSDEHHHHDLDLKSKVIPRSEKVEQKNTVKHENVKSQSRKRGITKDTERLSLKDKPQKIRIQNNQSKLKNKNFKENQEDELTDGSSKNNLQGSDRIVTEEDEASKSHHGESRTSVKMKRKNSLVKINAKTSDKSQNLDLSKNDPKGRSSGLVKQKRASLTTKDYEDSSCEHGEYESLFDELIPTVKKSLLNKLVKNKIDKRRRKEKYFGSEEEGLIDETGIIHQSNNSDDDDDELDQNSYPDVHLQKWSNHSHPSRYFDKNVNPMNETRKDRAKIAPLSFSRGNSSEDSNRRYVPRSILRNGDKRTSSVNTPSHHDRKKLQSGRFIPFHNSDNETSSGDEILKKSFKNKQISNAKRLQSIRFKTNDFFKISSPELVSLSEL